MAQALQIGEQVKVKRGFRPKPDSAAYQQGLKSVGPNLIGEVAGPAPEGRAWLVSFDGIQVPVTKQNLIRVAEVTKQPRGRRPKAEQTAPQAQPVPEPQSAESQRPDQEQAVPKRRGRRPGKAQPVEQPSNSTELGESGLQLLNLIANKMLLKGTVKVQSETAVEVSLSDLPAEVRQQLQRLIDAKLSLDLKSLVKR